MFYLVFDCQELALCTLYDACIDTQCKITQKEKQQKGCQEFCGIEKIKDEPKALLLARAEQRTYYYDDER